MMPLGSKYYHPLNNPGPKTGRLYGAIVSRVREILKRRKKLSARSLRMTKHQANTILSMMRKSGELKVLKPSTRGPYAKPAIYAPAK